LPICHSKQLFVYRFCAGERKNDTYEQLVSSRKMIEEFAEGHHDRQRMVGSS
jgi:hypothetical protein